MPFNIISKNLPGTFTWAQFDLLPTQMHIRHIWGTHGVSCKNRNNKYISERAYIHMHDSSGDLKSISQLFSK